jgi:hypothetical protein
MWDDRVGMAVNRVWTEVVRREKVQQKTQVQHELMLEYAMNGLDPSVDFSKRYNLVEPLLNKLLAEIDHTAYRTEYRRWIAKQKLQRLLDRKAEVDRLEIITSDQFNIADWVRGRL